MEYSIVLKGKFIERPNRFVAYVEVEGERKKCHVKNTGRCKELFVPGAEVILERAQNSDRKTKYSVVGVYKGDRLINIDSQAPNKVVYEALRRDMILHGATLIKPEFKYCSSRFDFYVEARDRWLIEVKGVTLERGGAVFFPDAPTVRGVRHLNELAEAVSDGYKSCVIFVVQMEEADYFAPNEETHPQFGSALRAAQRAGVKVLAYRCRLTEKSMEIGTPVQVRLSV